MPVKFKKITILATPVLLVAGVLAFRYYSLKPEPAEVLKPVATEVISSSQPTGGVQINDKKSNSKATSDIKITNRSSNSGSNLPFETPPSHQPAGSEPYDVVAKEYRYRALAEPNDPYYTSTAYPAWALKNTGAPAVWDQTTGNETVVAVIDTGFALQHEDLQTKWYQNPGETGLDANGKDKKSNGIDYDGNGYVDDWRGWNFSGSYQPSADPCNIGGSYVANNNPQAGSSGTNIEYAEYLQCDNINAGDPFEAVSHGTSSAGLTGAATNNGVGIASFNWNAKIMPLQSLRDDGFGWTSYITRAIRYAADNGASIINMSLGGPQNDPALQDAIDYAYSKNVLVIAAAGNCGTGNESGCDPAYPGAMGYPALNRHVLSVGATDINNNRASFSSYGPGLDLVAPGSGTIVSSLVNRGSTSQNPTTFNYTNAYSGSLYGTSFAAPIVSSMASLIKSVKPSYTVNDVTAILNGSASKVAGMNGRTYTDQYGHGLINANSFAIIAKALSGTAAATPVLRQTGDHQSEHSYSSMASMSSGCQVAASTYCTVWLQNSLGYDRYLPYKLGDAEGQIGWAWSGAVLGSGEWSARAVQGNNISNTPYQLFAK